MNPKRTLAAVSLALLLGGTALADGPAPPRPGPATAAPSGSPAAPRQGSPGGSPVPPSSAPRRGSPGGSPAAPSSAPRQGSPAGSKGSAPAAPAADRRLDLPVTAFTLANGMRFLVVPRHDVPTVAAMIVYRVGSAHERPGLTGGSHLLEHMMFKGTRRMGTTNPDAEAPIMRRIDQVAAEMLAEQQKLVNAYGGGDPRKVEALKQQIHRLQTEQKQYTVAEELWGVYQRNGAVGLNATTGTDDTRYFLNLPANRLELWAFLESDRMADPVFREFYTERDVVLEERRQSIDNRVSGRMFEALQAIAYAGSPYHWPIVGWPGDLQTMRREDVAAYFRTFYAPNNAVAVIVGDVRPDEVRTLADRYFARIPAHALPVEIPAKDSMTMGERRITVEMDSRPLVYTAYLGPAFGSPDEYALDIVSQILGTGQTSRLNRALVQDRRIAASAFAANYGRPLGNLFIVGGETQGSHTCRELEAAFIDELERLKTTPVEPWELERVKNNLEAGFIRGLRTNMGLASQLAEAEVHMGGWRNFDQRARWRAVTPERIMEVARRYFVARNRAVAELVPTSPAPPPTGKPGGTQ